MKYTIPVLSLATAIVARPAFTNNDYNVVSGEPFTLEFTGCGTGCTIILRNGAEGDLQDVRELTSSATGGSFTADLGELPSDRYTFQLINNETGEDNYSEQFAYEGTGEPSPSASVTTITSEIVKTTSSAATTSEEEETSTTASTTAESTATTPSSSATTTEESSSTTSEESTSTSAGGASESSGIPDPDEDAAGAVGVPMSLLMAVAAGMVFFN